MNQEYYVATNASVLGNVHIDEGSSIWFNAVLRCEVGSINIGKTTNIQDGCIIHTDNDHPVNIGSGVTIGHGCIIHGCTILDHCLIGMGSIVLNGAIIHDHCLIGAGSLITQHMVIPSYSVVYGSPAKIIRTLKPEEIDAIQHSADHYLELAQYYADHNQMIIHGLTK